MFRGQSITVKEEKEGPPMVSLNEVSSSRPCGSPHVVAQISDSLTDVLLQERENSPIEPSSEMGQPTQSQPITSRFLLVQATGCFWIVTKFTFLSRVLSGWWWWLCSSDLERELDSLWTYGPMATLSCIVSSTRSSLCHDAPLWVNGSFLT